MMEESENKSHTDNIVNVNYTSLYHTKKGKGTFPDITSPHMMDEYEDMKHRDKNDNET